MRFLVVSPRFPWPGHSGDRLRAGLWVEALSGIGDVALLSPPGPPGLGPTVVRRISVYRSAIALARSLAAWATGRAALHDALAGQYDWSRALPVAARDGEYDAAIVILTRTHKWVRRALPARRRVLDAIDALSANMEERALASRGVARAFWRREAAITRQSEAQCAESYDRIVVVSRDEAAAFGERAVCVPIGARVGPLESSHREFDFVFWGRLAYFANLDALELLLGEVWPMIRAARPASTLLLGGADAPRDLAKWHGRDGITVMTPFDDVPATLRRARVALFPVRFGSGQSVKLIEAAEAGCAIVASSKARRGIDVPDAAIVHADGAAAIAAAACALVDDTARTAAVAGAARGWVERQCDMEATLGALRRVVMEAPDK